MDARTESRPAKRQRFFTYAIDLVSSLLILAPAVFSVLYVRAFGVSVVFGDAWTIVPLFDKWSSGTLGFADLFRQHNEHRLFFPEGVELLLGSITKYDNLPEMYLIQICLLVTLVVLLLAFRDSIGSSLWLLLFVPISFLVFSFRQFENMLFGYQISFAFAQTFGVLALFLLYVLGRGRRFEKLAFAGALTSATVASFSALQGLFVWPAGLLQLFVSPLEKPKKRLFVILWGLVGLGEWIAYFVDYRASRNKPSLLYVLENPLSGMEFLLRSLGSPLFGAPNPALLSGLLLAFLALASLFLVYRDRRLNECSFWISLLLYSLLMLAAITVGRSGLGPGLALVSRYTAFSILAVISIYAILVKATFQRTSISRSTISAILFVALFGTVLLGVSTSYPNGIALGNQTMLSREAAALALSTYESQPDEVLERSLNPRAEVVRENAPVLQRLGYNVFSEPNDQPATAQSPPPGRSTSRR